MKRSKETLGMWSLYVIGYSYKEISDCFKVTPKTVSNRIEKEYGKTEWYEYIKRPMEPVTLSYYDPAVISRLAKAHSQEVV
jgi:hypothetical protein